VNLACWRVVAVLEKGAAGFPQHGVIAVQSISGREWLAGGRPGDRHRTRQELCGMTASSDPSKPDRGTLAPALGRLNEAMARLEAAVEARLEREAALGEAEAEVQRMGADRTRLAESLDSAEARAVRLENTNREVSRRLVDAMEAIRAVLDRHGQGEE
jgi:hypothetical protein